MGEGDVQDLLHLGVVSRDVEPHAIVVLGAGDVDRDQVLADLGPFDSTRAGGGDVKYFGPQTTYWETGNANLKFVQ